MHPTTYNLQQRREMNRAMLLSLGVGFFMLLLKCYAYFLTGSAAILSDSAESVVHVFAVGFAAYSMWLSHQPADQDHTYGHDRIAFFSAGFEGALILVAALFILYQAVQKLIMGVHLEHVESGVLFISLATLLNGVLGLFLIRKGRKFHSLVLEADGKHILTDCITSLGVLAALILTQLTGWLFLDPLIALVIGLNIFWTGSQLVYQAVHGLMDRADPERDRKIRQVFDHLATLYPIAYHQVRHRDTGNRLLIEVHLMFPAELSIARAHEIATCIEKEVEKAFAQPTELVTHLEPLEGHDEIHARLLGRGG